MKLRIGAGAIVVTLALALAAAGCGSSDDGSNASTQGTVTPQQGVAEIAKVRSGLAAALATYKAGRHAAADQQVGDTYLSHFELVEQPLAEADSAFKLSLEAQIRETLRDEMQKDAPYARVAALVGQIDARLDQAKAKLQ